jgi:hypothetical protein
MDTKTHPSRDGWVSLLPAVPREGSYFFFAGFEAFFCDSALPAADLEVVLVLPSRRVFEAALAAFADVASLGALVWVSALPAADFDALPVDPLDSVFEALVAAALPVSFFAIAGLSCGSKGGGAGNHRLHRKYSCPVHRKGVDCAVCLPDASADATGGHGTHLAPAAAVPAP